MKITLDAFQKSNRVYEEVRQIIHESFKQVVEQMPQTNREEVALVQGRFLSACDFVASVASLFCAYDNMMEGEPDIAGLYRALGDLSFGFETNQFYVTFKGFLHPALVISINAWLDSVEHSFELEARDNALTRQLHAAARLSWLNIVFAAAFCLGGYGFARQVSTELREKIIRVI